jgi:hypothetical protein
MPNPNLGLDASSPKPKVGVVSSTPNPTLRWTCPSPPSRLGVDGSRPNWAWTSLSPTPPWGWGTQPRPHPSQVWTHPRATKVINSILFRSEWPKHFIPIQKTEPFASHFKSRSVLDFSTKFRLECSDFISRVSF